jgi:4-diphosphocytidyl-2-C-methyl-D-erythritol kinase
VTGDGSVRLRVRVPAKINLHLAVGPRRPDGYHDVESVLQTVTLYDTLRLRGVDDGQALHPATRRRMALALTADGVGTDGDVPVDAGNLVLVAGRRLMAELGMGTEPSAGGPCTRLHLTKRIPVAAGMAGGSADAAAALVGLDRLWGTGLGLDRLRDLAADVGSDVPFCVVGGTGLAAGRGTAVARVLTRGTAHWVVGVDAGGLSTAAVYRAFDELPPPRRAAPDLVLQALRTGDVEALAAGLHNDLEPAAFALRPDLRERRDALLDAGALAAVVSGSGPTLLALAEDALHARALADHVAGDFARVEVVAAPAGGPEVAVEA